ncbi:MAG: myo-inositol-1(or 4)-monophosphatase [Alphaproteobacteria bacterium]
MFNKKSQPEYFASLLKTLVVEAGSMARHMRLDAKAQEKDDMSIVTTADLAVSELIAGRLSNFLERDDHILIDEETADKLPPMDEVLSKDYQWVLDPIDGTAPFFAGLPFYGVSLGLMRKGEPWLGAVYLPELDDLFWTDGKGNVMRQRGAKGASTPRALLKPDVKLYDHTPVLNTTLFENHRFSGYSIGTGSAVCDGVFACQSNAAGIISQAYIWDQAALFALYKTLGFNITNTATNKEFSKFDGTWLSDNWKLKEPFIAALPENLTFIKNKFEYLGATKVA